MFEFGILSKVFGRRRLPVACIALSVIVAAVAISSTAPAEGIQSGVVSTFDVLGTTEAALVLTEEVVGPDGFDKNTMVPVVTDERHASTSASQVPVHPSDRPFDDSVETDEGYIGAPARVRSVYAGSSETFPPSVSVAWPSPFLSVNVGHNQDFSVNASDQDGNISQVEWYLNDTSRWIESLSATGSIAKTYTHTFAETGDYLVKVVFTDVDGLTGSASWRIRVVNENVATSDYSLVSGPASQFDLDDVFEGRNTNFSAIWKSGNTADDSLPQLELTIQDVDGVILQGYLLVAAPRTAWIDYQNIDVQVQDGSGFDAGTWEQYVPPQDPNSQIVASVNYLLGSFFSIANFLYDDGTGRVTRPTSTLFSGNELNCYQHVAVAWDLGPGGAHEKDGVRVNIPLAAVSAGDRLAVFAHLSVDNTLRKNASTGGIDFPNLFSSEEPFPSCNPPSLSRPRSPESAPLGNPTGLTAEPGSGSGEVVLRWTPATNATMHWVYLEKVDGTDGRYWPHAQAGNTARLTVTGLDAGETYLFLVIAGQEQADGTPQWSQWSNWGQATLPATAPASPASAATNSISSGGEHTCGLRADGSAVCWGRNSLGQATPPVGETFAAISSGYDYTCGLRADGSAACWGRNNYGQATPPVGETFAAISSGHDHTCGLRADGSAVCWGRNREGQLTQPLGETFAAIISGYFHTCGLRADGSAACWGWNDQGQATAPAGETFTAISSAGHTCGLRADGSAVCWGWNDYGQATPPPGATFAAISSGGGHTCGLRADGSVVCWGRNDYGQATPPAGATFAAISSGTYHTCGLRADGSVVCWGRNDYGQATPPAGATFAVATAASNGEYDTDGDRLIEISSLEQLDAIRYDLDGDGISSDAAYGGAFPISAGEVVCDDCNGYELIRSLDFRDPGSYLSGSVNAAWITGSGWQPIAGGIHSWPDNFDTTISGYTFTATLAGNGHTVSNLYANRSSYRGVALFRHTGRSSVIRDIALTEVNLTGGNDVGALAGYGFGKIIASYASGAISGRLSVGGLTGTNEGGITASYSKVDVQGIGHVGGLVGWNAGSIDASYAVGKVAGVRHNTGGLSGVDSGSVRAGYWDRQTSGQTTSAGGEGQTTVELQAPTGYTGIYGNWNVDVDGDTLPDDPWDFGNPRQYPVLKYGGFSVAGQR